MVYLKKLGSGRHPPRSCIDMQNLAHIAPYLIFPGRHPLLLSCCDWRSLRWSPPEHL